MERNKKVIQIPSSGGLILSLAMYVKEFWRIDESGFILIGEKGEESVYKVIGETVAYWELEKVNPY